MMVMTAGVLVRPQLSIFWSDGITHLTVTVRELWDEVFTHQTVSVSRSHCVQTRGKHEVRHKEAQPYSCGEHQQDRGRKV